MDRNGHAVHGYNLAYNARPQRVLDSHSPDEAVRQHLKERPELANPACRPPNPRELADIKAAAQFAVLSAEEASQPYNNTPVDAEERGDWLITSITFSKSRSRADNVRSPI